MPTTNGREQVFNDGIKNNDSRPADISANYLVTQNADGTFGKIDPILLPLSTATISADTNLSNQIDASNDLISGLEASKLDRSEYNDRFKGKFTSLANLEVAYPTANIGDYAQVDEGVGFEVLNYNWDAEEGWVQGGSGSSATNTDALPEGSVNLYFDPARVLATVLTGISFITGGAIVSTDSVLVAFGKLQKQITDALTAIGLKQDLLVSGTNIKTIGGTSLLGAGNINVSKILVFDNAPKTALTGTTTATILASYLIPANSIPVNSILRITCRLIKTGTAGIMTININNDGSSVSNGCRFVNASSTGASPSNTLMAVKRDSSLRGGNAIILSNSGVIPTDITNGVYTTATFDTTINQTIYVWGTLANGADSLNFEHLIIETIS